MSGSEHHSPVCSRLLTLNNVRYHRHTTLRDMMEPNIPPPSPLPSAASILFICLCCVLLCCAVSLVDGCPAQPLSGRTAKVYGPLTVVSVLSCYSNVRMFCPWRCLSLALSLSHPVSPSLCGDSTKRASEEL